MKNKATTLYFNGQRIHNANNGQWTVNQVFLPGYWPEESEEDKRKTKVMENLFHVGVVFKHKNSKVLWEITEVRKEDDGAIRFAVAKSRKSGYKKAIWASGYSYDTFELIEAPQAVKVLYGDKKHGGTTITETNRITSQSPETAETAFEETDLSEIDPSNDTL